MCWSYALIRRSGADVFELFQRSQCGFHKAVLLLVAFDGGDEFADFGEGLAEGFSNSLGLCEKCGRLIFVNFRSGGRRRSRWERLSC